MHVDWFSILGICSASSKYNTGAFAQAPIVNVGRPMPDSKD